MSNQSDSAKAKSSEEIARDIATAIVERRLPAGTKLKEEALARLYSVSRTKIRAALLMLSKDDLIEIVPEKGACVSRLTRAEAQDIFAVRCILEAALTREFVAKASEADYLRIEQHLVQERQAVLSSNPQLRSKLLAEFHTLLAEIVGNQVLLDILRKLAVRTSLAAMRSQSERHATCSSDEHAAFIQAAKSGDVEGAVTLMMDHLHHVQEGLAFDDDPQEKDNDLIRALLA